MTSRGRLAYHREQAARSQDVSFPSSHLTYPAIDALSVDIEASAEF